MHQAIDDSIAAEAAAAIATENWGRLRYIGNGCERARRYRDAWSVLAQLIEASSPYTLPLWPGPDQNADGVLVLPRSRDLGDHGAQLREGESSPLIRGGGSLVGEKLDLHYLAGHASTSSLRVSPSHPTG